MGGSVNYACSVNEFHVWLGEGSDFFKHLYNKN